jgi:hypothetical protein
MVRMSECNALSKSDVKDAPNGLLVKIVRKKTDKSGMGQTFLIPDLPDLKCANPVVLFEEYSKKNV